MLTSSENLRLVIVGLVGYAVRERSAGYAFSAGLVTELAVVLGYTLGIVTDSDKTFGIAELVTLVIPISYADPEEVAQVLRDTVLSPRGRVQVMGAPRLLLVTEVAGSRASRARRAARGLDG